MSLPGYGKVMAVFFALGLLCGGGCKAKSPDKCEQAVVKSLDLAISMMEEMAKKVPGEKGVQVREEMKAKKAEMRADMDERKPALVATCKEALVKAPEATKKGLDCILDSKSVQHMMQCPGIDFLR